MGSVYPLKLLPAAFLSVFLSFALFTELRAVLRPEEAPGRVPIKNANFEQGTNGWELNNFGKGGTMAIDRTVLHDGKPTLRIESFGQLTFVQQAVKVKPHTTYLLSGYVKVKDVHEDGGAGIAGAVVMMGQSQYGSQGVYGTADWQKVTTQLNTDDKTEIRVGPGVGWWATKIYGTGWFSDLSLTELGGSDRRDLEGPERNLVTNANFEKATYGWELIDFGTDGTLELDPNELHDGKPTLRVDATNGMTFARQVVTVKAHTNYRLSGYVKVKDLHEIGGGGKTGACLIVGSTEISTRAINGTTDDWQEISIEFNTKDKTAIRVGPSVGFYAHKVTGTGWFSDLSLTEAGDKKAAN